LFTLYDVWIYNQLKFDDPIISWVPIDHVNLVPDVARFLSRPNVTPVTMAPHGQRLLEKAGIESTYIPHAIDTRLYKPTETIAGKPAREFIGIPEDAFLVTMVSANKANGIQHRKGLGEALTSFSIYQRENPKAHLYLHMEPGNAYGGFVIPRLLQTLGIPKEAVTVADQNQLRIGYPPEAVAGIYTASDVLLLPSYGEGFGLPILEAQACGTRVITGSWTSMVDLAGPTSWCISGQPLWDETQGAFYQMPLIGSIVEALRLAADAPRGVDEEAIKFAGEFEVEKVWQEKWLPFFKGFFDVA
jgi:glycosyltransferase involved in cell wall biosynthesis